MSGHAEFNGDMILRGNMAAMSGEFSGKFAADNVNALRAINIRDGAVSVTRFLEFSTPQRDLRFALSAPRGTDLVEIIVPCIAYLSKHSVNQLTDVAIPGFQPHFYRFSSTVYRQLMPSLFTITFEDRSEISWCHQSVTFHLITPIDENCREIWLKAMPNDHWGYSNAHLETSGTIQINYRMR